MITKRKRFDRRYLETTEQIPRVADAVRIARVAQLGGSSMRMAEVDPFYDPLEDSLDDLASEWGETEAGEADDHLTWMD